MGKQYQSIGDDHVAFINAQRMFFVATSAAGCRINLSPKGLDSLRILDSNRVVWLNLTGSGNETAAHLAEDGRMTIMFCAFEGDPKILRLYGKARAIQADATDWQQWLALFPPQIGARQVIEMKVDLVQTSCGFGVPLYDFVGHRDLLDKWAEKKGAEGIRQYWHERNATTLDGKPTGIPTN